MKIAQMIMDYDTRIMDFFVTNSAWVEDHAIHVMLYHGKMMLNNCRKILIMKSGG